VGLGQVSVLLVLTGTILTYAIVLTRGCCPMNRFLLSSGVTGPAAAGGFGRS